MRRQPKAAVTASFKNIYVYQSFILKKSDRERLIHRPTIILPTLPCREFGLGAITPGTANGQFVTFGFQKDL
jgi:hypothetical protein